MWRHVGLNVGLDLVKLFESESALAGQHGVTAYPDDFPDHRVTRDCLFVRANGFERAVLRWSLSHQRGKFNFARDQIRSLKFSFAHQCSRVPTDVAEHKFDGAEKRDGVIFVQSPLCLRRLGGAPNLRGGIRQLQRAFAVTLRLKAQ
jgi:hypothetical protein